MPTNGNASERQRQEDGGTIAIPPPATRAYLRSFSIACIAITTERAVMVARDIGRIRQPIIAAWWASQRSSTDSSKLSTRTRSTDIAATAKALRVSVTPHAVVIERASERVDRISNALEQARRDGTLHEFNARYRAMRRQAQAEGRYWPQYALAFSRLKRGLFKAAAAGARLDRSIIDAALGVASEKR